jgi:hypothetical protein
MVEILDVRVYSRICTFLLQLQRTKYLLDQVSGISLRRGTSGDEIIVHAVRIQLIWFVNTLLTYVGIVVSSPSYCGG